MAVNNVSSDIHRHNWVTYMLGRLFLRSKERQVSYKLYAYLRQVDDFIDESGAERDECLAYVRKQRAIVHELYSNGAAAGDSLLSQIVEHDRMNGHKFKECIDLMMDVFEFDARRKKNKPVSAHELRTYSMDLARAYTRFLIYFVEPRYQHSENDILLAHACHLAHMIRDLMVDYNLGYINIAQEDLDAFALKPGYLKGAVLSRWLEHEVRGIKELMEQGKQALHACRLLRIKIMGLLYCFRYEAILHRIESARYSLQEKYQVRIIDYIRLCGQCFAACVKHLFQCVKI